MKKENRLNRLRKELNDCWLKEEKFDNLYKKLKDEIKREIIIDKLSSFAFQLKQTKDGQASDYIWARKKEPSIRHTKEYQQFIEHFRLDISLFGKISIPITTN